MAGSYSETGRLFPNGSATGLVVDSFMLAKDYAERARREEAQNRQDAYQDDFRDTLEERISQTFTGANAEELCKVLDTTNNPLKRIVNEVSVLYTQRPSRKLANDGATKLYREVLKRAGDGVVMPRLNRMVNLHNTVLVYVRPAFDSLTLRLILPQDCSVIPDPDDPTMPLFVEFRSCDPSAVNAKPEYYQFDRRPGSAGTRRYDANGKQIGGTLPPQYFDGDRPLIPIVAFHREWPDYSFWDSTSGDDLYELTIMVGMWETWINHLIRTDSFRQKYATGEVDVSVPQEGGPTSMVQVRSVQGSPVSVGEFSSQADWNGLGGQAKRKLENVLGNVGLVLPDTRTSGDPTSGFALTVRASGLIKLQRAQVPSYERSEESLFRVVSIVHNFEINNPKFPALVGAPLPPLREADLQVAYAPVESQRTVEERKAELEIAESEIRLGLASPITVYMRSYPEATEEEARAAIEKNKADTDSLKPEPPPGMPVPGQPMMEPPEDPDESEDDEADKDAPPRK